MIIARAVGVCSLHGRMHIMGGFHVERKKVDPLPAILGMARQIQRKSQGIGAIARRRYMRESASYQYIAKEVDNIYSACARLLRELGQ